ncbi:nucleoside-diphosphate sugar epimerase, partial [Mycobacterium sp. ITM-2017-0098]
VFLNSRALGADLADFVDAAARQGVKRLVALSAINADDDFSRQPSRARGDRNREVEQLAIASGLEWISLRPTVFVSNFAGMWAAQILAGDLVVGPAARAAMAPIEDGDIAAVAAVALLTDDLVGRRVELTGPQSLTNIELVEIIGEVLNRQLRYHEVSASAVRSRFAEMGFPSSFADAYIEMLAAAEQRPARVTGEVAEAIGRPPTTFSDAIRTRRDLFTKNEGKR